MSLFTRDFAKNSTRNEKQHYGLYRYLHLGPQGSQSFTVLMVVKIHSFTSSVLRAADFQFCACFEIG